MPSPDTRRYGLALVAALSPHMYTLFKALVYKL
jgi:hypothetical protein